MPAPLAFDASTPAEAQTKPCRVSEIRSGGRERTIRSVSSRIAWTWRGSRSPASSRARSEGTISSSRDDPAFGLGDDLLRDDDDVAALEPARARSRLREQRREIVAGLDLGDTLEPEDAVAAAHRSDRPVTRKPACAL